MNNEQLAVSSEQWKRGFLRVIFPLLIAICSLLIACHNPFELPKQEEPAEGRGYFSLSINGASTRTIMPPLMQEGDFEAYTLEFFESGTTTNPALTVERGKGNLSDTILLNAGTWDLYVTAYTDEERTTAVAQGELKGIVISTGETSVRNISLRPITYGTTGTFSWVIDYSDSVTEASMTVTRMPVTPESVPAHTVIFTSGGAKTGSVELLTGYYRVAFKLKNSEGLEAERWETLHVYQNMESEFEDTLELLSSPYDIEDFGERAVIDNVFNVEDADQWNDVVSAIANTPITDGRSGNYVINVLDDFDVAGFTGTAANDYTFRTATGIKVSLRGRDTTMSLNSPGRMLLIQSNQSLILRDLTLKGYSSYSNSYRGLVMTFGTFTMKSGTIADNINGGVNVQNQGTFIMDGGEICRNSCDGGGGVTASGGAFIMNDGIITGNTSTGSTTAYGGGVYLTNNGTFTMNGGTISGNIANSGGGGVYGPFTMNGGTITGNYARSTSSNSLTDGGGVYTSGSGTFTMNGGTISGNYARSGGGVYMSGPFRMVTGTISGNSSTGTGSNSGGGGVYMSGGTFTMENGVISGNTVSGSSINNGGGGVYTSGSGTFTMKNGEISGNTANGNSLSNGGGGVYVNTNGTFTMESGGIFGNKATGTASGNGGGGVYVYTNGTFLMITGTIYGSNEVDDKFRNTANEGAAVYRLGTALGGNGTSWTAGNSGTLITNEATIIMKDGGHEEGSIIPIPASNVYNVSTALEWNAALCSIAFFGDGEELTINVLADFEVAGYTSGMFGRQSKVTITGTGRTVTLGGNNRNMLRIGSGHTVELQGLTLRGNAPTSSNTALVSLTTGGDFTMKSGTITGNTNSGNGGGVNMDGGTFTMDGGAISGNTAVIGGGVYVSGANARFTMNGGNISENKFTITSTGSSNGGGGVYVAGTSASFTLDGGTISGNSLTATGSNYGGGGVHVSNGTFTMKSGTISGNTGGSGGGVSISSSGNSFTMKGGEISGNTARGTGGGVSISSGGNSFTMEDGTISGNTAATGGGGVHTYGTFTMESGTISGNTITGNTTGGGGVYVNGTFNMKGGEISGNKGEGPSNNGGGVYVGGTFNMDSGEISGNTATGNGGGVYVYGVTNSGGAFTLDGGTISGNTATGNGGGVYVSDSSYSIFHMITGTIYGSNEADEELKNTANEGAAVYKAGVGTSLGGNGDDWTVSGSGTLITNEATIIMDKGDPKGSIITIPDSKVYTVTTAAGWNEALSSIAYFGEGDGEELTVNVQDDFVISGYTSDIFGRQCNVTISGTGTITLSGTGNMLRMRSGNTVELQSLNLQGHAAGTSAMVYVTTGGKFTMQSGTITGHTTSGNGAGVNVNGDDAIFIMNGGTISGNTSTTTTTGGGGGGVYVTGTRASFTMNGGEISGNTHSNGGGVYVGSSGTFTMYDGKISDNIGRGVYVYSGTFTMNGGEISDNTGNTSGSGVYMNGGSFTMNGGTISGNTGTNNGGGIFMNSGTLTMTGGKISGNTAGTSGGGVYVASGTFTMEDGEISGNTAGYYGGGVYMSGGTFTMHKGTISGNTNNGTGDSGGGGVWVTNSGTFTMRGGEISGNEATGSNGGGVCMSSGTFTMRGGEIFDNTARNGGGVYLYNSSNAIFRIVTGTIYGTDADDGLPNAATVSGAVLYKNANGIAQRGTFGGDTGTTWNSSGTLDAIIETTLRVEEGEMVQ